LAIEAAGPEQRGVENFWPVRRSEQYDAGRGVETVELGEELIKRLFLLVQVFACLLVSMAVSLAKINGHG
jgi:hypothetical protein